MEGVNIYTRMYIYIHTYIHMCSICTKLRVPEAEQCGLMTHDMTATMPLSPCMLVKLGKHATRNGVAGVGAANYTVGGSGTASPIWGCNQNE